MQLRGPAPLYRTTHPSRLRQALVSILAANFFLVGLATEVDAQVSLYTIHSENDQLVELAMSPDGEVSEEQRWDRTDGLGFPLSLEVGNDGNAYLLVTLAISASLLIRKDLETGAEEVLTGLSVAFNRMALHQDGRIWILRLLEELHVYDPEADTLTLVSTLPDGLDLGGMGWRGDELYVLLRPSIPDTNPSLARVDTTTGNLLDIHPLPGLVERLTLPHTFRSIDFDDEGGLWIGVSQHVAVIDPPTHLGTVAYYADPWTDSEPTIGAWSEVLTFDVFPIAATGRSVVLDVPSLNSLGLTALVLLLACAAIRTTGRLKSA